MVGDEGGGGRGEGQCSTKSGIDESMVDPFLETQAKRGELNLQYSWAFGRGVLDYKTDHQT
jgi:hypothetical protein